MAARGYVIEGAVVIPATVSVTPEPPPPDETDERLRQLDSLQADGLITRDEYFRKRLEIVGPAGQTAEGRFLQLRDLLHDKLISKDEYDRKRQEILDAL